MKTTLMTLALLAGLPLALSAQVNKEEIKKLAAAGISDEVILSYIRANGGIGRLSAEDVVELKQAGASEKLLAAILGPAPAAQAGKAPASAPVPTAPPPVGSDLNTYVAPATSGAVYDASPYYGNAVYSSGNAVYSSYYPYYPYYYPYYGGVYGGLYLGWGGYWGRGYGYPGYRYGYSGRYVTPRGAVIGGATVIRHR